MKEVIINIGEAGPEQVEAATAVLRELWGDKYEDNLIKSILSARDTALYFGCPLEKVVAIAISRAPETDQELILFLSSLVILSGIDHIKAELALAPVVEA